MKSTEIVIAGKKKDLGGFSVSRLLPTIQKRSVGPFIFLDHMGPILISQKHKLDVRPHPHIGLSTVTYLFSGSGFHRDSIGSQQIITPGDINWMTAGRGIVHSERTPKEILVSGETSTLHGIQFWVGLPKDLEETDPSFTHYPTKDLPEFTIQGLLECKLLMGEFLNYTSPVKASSRIFFADFKCLTDATASLRFAEKEMAIMCINGQLEVNEQTVPPDSLIVLDTSDLTVLKFTNDTRFIAIGGTPFPEPRYMWWNFVSSRKERIRQAAEDWKNQSMGKVPTETEFIPLPNDPLP